MQGPSREEEGSNPVGRLIARPGSVVALRCGRTALTCPPPYQPAGKTAG